MGAKIAQVRALATVSYAPAAPRISGRGDQASRSPVPGSPAPEDVVLPGQDFLPVLPALQGLLPSAGLQRGQVITTDGGGLLCLALAAGASASGAWCAAVGLPGLGVRAAIDAGLDHDRLLLVADPGVAWPQVVAALLDGCDIVLLRPPDRPSAQLRRKLEATARRHGSVLLVAGEWEGAQTRLLVASREWAGIGAGHGRLRARRVQVVAEGRGAGTRPRAAWLWLPGPDGAVAPAADPVSPDLASPRPAAVGGAAVAGTALVGTG